MTRLEGVRHQISVSLRGDRDQPRPWRSDRAASRISNVLVINGHPDPRPERFCSALCDAYVRGSQTANRNVRRLEVGQLSVALAGLQAAPFAATSAYEFEAALDLICWAGHLTIVFPLWLDAAPLPLQCLLRAACNRRAESAVGGMKADSVSQTARTVVTMEMPAFAHRSMFGPKGRTTGKATCLSMPSVKTQAPIFIGCVNTISDRQRQGWLGRMHRLGLAGA